MPAEIEKAEHLTSRLTVAAKSSETPLYVPPTQEVIDETRQLAESFDCTTVTDVPAGECQALVALYVSTNGVGWTNSTNWLTSTSVSGWYGVEVADGHVTHIVLENNRLSGSIPAALGSLGSLEYLDLAFNQLTGNIPAELGSLGSLECLDLASNQLSGNIPAALGQLSALMRLSLDYNQLSSSIPAELGQLSKLAYLTLSENQLSGNIPAELGQLSELYLLRLAGNQLDGNIPAELGQLTRLWFLDLSRNQLSGSIPKELGQISNLEWLYLSSNQLSGKIPKELNQLSRLEKLRLSSNQLSGSIPAELGQLRMLCHLDLSSNQLSGSIPVALGSLGSLEYLDLSSSQLSGSIPLTFVNLTALISFNFMHTSLCEPSSEAFLSWKQTITNWIGTGIVCGEIGDASWLLMYYGAGDNELDRVIAGEVSEIIAKRHQNVDIAIFLDSLSQGSFYRFYKNNGVQEEIEKPSVNSGDGSSLSDFMSWAMSKTTASRQALIIAGHGHGLSGVVRDDRANQDSIFVNGELRNALLVNGPIDVVYGHAGLTANLEFMWELRGLSDYYVASESASFSTHHDYIGAIYPDTTAEELAVSIANSYYRFRNNSHSPSTVSVVDMTYLDEVFVATNNLAKAIFAAPSDLKTNLWGVLGHTSLQRFDERSPHEINDGDRLADLFHFADLARSFDALSIAAQALIDLQNNFVIYNHAWSGEYYDGAPWSHNNARGVSIAVPLSPMSFYDGAWLEFATGADWTFTGAVTQPPTSAEGFDWGPMVSNLVALNNASGENDVTPPELVPLLVWYSAYLPLVVKSAAH